MSITKKALTPALALTLPLVAALGLAGCSSTAGSRDAASTAAPTASTSAPTAASASASASAVPGSTPSGSSGTGSLIAAARTATAAVSGSQVLSIEQEAGGTSWEVLVATTDGEEQEVHTTADGSSVTSGPTRETSDQADRTENTAFLAADRIGYQKAARSMTDRVSGTVTELGLDDHRGTTVWEGDVLDSAGTKHSIRLDASTGAVITSAVDSDD